jgi:hypothetical protein
VNIAHGAKGTFNDLERKLYGAEIPGKHYIGNIIVQAGCKFTAEDPKYKTISSSYTYSVLSWTVIPFVFHNFVGLIIFQKNTKKTVEVEKKVLEPRKFECECYETVTISYIQVKQVYSDILTKWEILKIPPPTFIIIWVMSISSLSLTMSFQTDGSTKTEVQFGLSWKQVKIEVKDPNQGLQLFGPDLKKLVGGGSGGFLFFAPSATKGQLKNGPEACGPCAGVAQGFFEPKKGATAPIKAEMVLAHMTQNQLVKNDFMLGAFMEEDEGDNTFGDGDALDATTTKGSNASSIGKLFLMFLF